MIYRFTVVDEADELLHPDWEVDFNKVIAGAGKCQSRLVNVGDG